MRQPDHSQATQPVLNDSPSEACRALIDQTVHGVAPPCVGCGLPEDVVTEAGSLATLAPLSNAMTPRQSSPKKLPG